MENRYKCSLQVGGRGSDFEAMDLPEFLDLFASELYQMERNAAAAERESIEKKVESLVWDYEEKVVGEGNARRSAIMRHGLLPAVARCYLEGKTIRETMAWLGKEKGFMASVTAVGRFWPRFRQLCSRKNPT